MPSRVAAIDLDAVVADTMGTMNRLRVLEGLRPLPAPRTWDMTEYRPEDQKYCFAKFKQAGYYQFQRPVKYAVPGLWVLSQHYELVYITSRCLVPNEWNPNLKSVDLNIERVTRRWLNDWDLPPARLAHCSTSLKGSWTREAFGDRLAFAVEDCPTAIIGYAQAGTTVYAIDYAYNRDCDINDRVVRVKNLFDVVDHRNQVDWLDLPGRTTEFETWPDFHADMRNEAESDPF